MEGGSKGFSHCRQWQNCYIHLEKKLLANLLDTRVVSVFIFLLVISSFFYILWLHDVVRNYRPGFASTGINGKLTDLSTAKPRFLWPDMGRLPQRSAQHMGSLAKTASGLSPGQGAELSSADGCVGISSIRQGLSKRSLCHLTYNRAVSAKPSKKYWTWSRRSQRKVVAPRVKTQPSCKLKEVIGSTTVYNTMSGSIFCWAVLALSLHRCGASVGPPIGKHMALGAFLLFSSFPIPVECHTETGKL